MMLAAPLLALLAFPLVQDAAKEAPSATPSANETWKELDRVVVIVNEDIFTFRALQAQLVRLKNRMGLGGKDALQEAQSEILTAGVRERLWIQAGLDLGLEPAQVQRMVRDHLERLQDRFGGVVGLSEYFKSLELDSTQAKEKLQEDVYKDVFDNYITGDNPTAIGRPNRDTYVRPGMLRFQYRNVLSSRRNLAQIGGKPQEVVLQLLILDPRHFSDLEAGRVLAEQLRERILDGEDMGQLNEQYGGMKRNGGVTDPLDETRVAQVDATLGTFLRDADPGDLSTVIEYRNESVSTWRLVRVVDRTPGQTPEFTSPEVQEALIKSLEDGRREYRREFAFKRLVKASYVWPAELAGGERPTDRPNGN